MLEANTDRAYFMIGAVVIAALLIAGAIYIFGGDSGVIGNIKSSITGLFNKVPDVGSPVLPK